MSRAKGYKNPNAGRNRTPVRAEIKPKEIILEHVLYWIGLQATEQEIAGSFRVDINTLNARLIEHTGMNFSELKKRYDGEGKMSLRRYQFKQSEKNATMAIWLGKNWLDQKDRDDDKKYIPPNDLLLDMQKRIIALENEKYQLEDKLNAIEQKAGPKLLPGDETD